jgi:hypothetical protein
MGDTAGQICSGHAPIVTGTGTPAQAGMRHACCNPGFAASALQKRELLALIKFSFQSNLICNAFIYNGILLSKSHSQAAKGIAAHHARGKGLG